MKKHLFIFAFALSSCSLFGVASMPDTNAVVNAYNSLMSTAVASDVDPSVTNSISEIGAKLDRIITGLSRSGGRVLSVGSDLYSLYSEVASIRRIDFPNFFASLATLTNDTHEIIGCFNDFFNRFDDFQTALFWYLDQLMQTQSDIHNAVWNIEDFLVGSNLVVQVHPVISNVTIMVSATNAIPVRLDGGGGGDSASANVVVTDWGANAKTSLVVGVNTGFTPHDFGDALFKWTDDLFSDEEWHEEYLLHDEYNIEPDDSNFYNALIDYQKANLQQINYSNQGLYRILLALQGGAPMTKDEVEELYNDAENDVNQKLQEFEGSDLPNYFTWHSLFGSWWDEVETPSRSFTQLQQSLSDDMRIDTFQQLNFTINGFTFLGESIDTVGGDLLTDVPWLVNFIEFMRLMFKIIYSFTFFMIVVYIARVVATLFLKASNFVAKADDGSSIK